MENVPKDSFAFCRCEWKAGGQKTESVNLKRNSEALILNSQTAMFSLNQREYPNDVEEYDKI